MKQKYDVKKEVKRLWGWIFLVWIILFITLGITLVHIIKDRETTQPPQTTQPEYETYIIKLDNNNFFDFIDGEVVDYVCDEGVYVSNYGDSFYVSTWEDDPYVEEKYKGMKAQCMVKIEK